MVSKGGQVDVGGQAPKASVLYLLANSGLMADPCVLEHSRRASVIRPELSPSPCSAVSSSSRSGGANLAKAADRLQITSRGFQFLLEDVHTQQWDLMLNYLRLAPVRLIERFVVSDVSADPTLLPQDRDMDPIEALAFLFMLGNLELGRGYSTENLTATQLTMLEDLAETGFIYRRSKTSKRFYPTRLASSLSSSAFSQSDSTAFPTSSSSLVTAATGAGREPAAQAQGFIIVETNFRVYAYTSNLLQIAVLNLFVQFKARFPDMVVGEITRGKMKGALEKGITADQVRELLRLPSAPRDPH